MKPWHGLTREERAQAAGERARSERLAQGFSEMVEDPVVLERIARMAAPAIQSERAS